MVSTSVAEVFSSDSTFIWPFLLRYSKGVVQKIDA